MATMIDRFVVKFEKSKKALSGKIFATYGKWNDKWNINKVLLQCRNAFFLVDILINSTKLEYNVSRFARLLTKINL
jgi:hypothetical protein